jgi:pyruvate dehydrogenase E1 component alpha subunit
MHTPETLRAFERRIADLFNAGALPHLIHLSGGNEEQLIEIFGEIRRADWVFSTHRNHYHYLLKGGSEEKLERWIREGRSMFIFDKEFNFVSSSILAGTCAMAAGVALEIKRSGADARVYCFLGDGAEDQGHFYEAARLVDGWGLPCEFIIEDNGVSVDTSHDGRWGTSRRFPWPFPCIHRYFYERTWPHAGTGGPKVAWPDAQPPLWHTSHTP